MARKSLSPTSAPSDSPVTRLTDAVEHLAQNVIVLSDILDVIREDLSWLTRNCVPAHQPVGQAQETPTAPAVRKRTRRNRQGRTQSPDGSSNAISQSREAMDGIIDEVVMRLAEPLGEIAQEQLNILLGVLESARKEIATAIRGANHPAPLLDALMQPSASVAIDSAGGQPTERNVPAPGSLF